MEKLPNEKAEVAGAESLPTAQSLQEQMDGLRAQVEAAKREKEKDVEQKLAERESLIADLERNDALFNQANEMLEYFTSIQELGQLQGEGVQKLDELRNLTTSLGEKRAEMDEKVSVISSRPEIQEKLYDAAKQEGVERDVEKILAEAREELEPKIEKMTNDIRSYTEDVTRREENKKRMERAADVVWQQVKDVVGRAENMVGEKSELPRLLKEDVDKATTLPELNQLLVERRKALGFFKGKEKAAIDFILASFSRFARDMASASEGKAAADASSERNKMELARIEKEYQDIVSAASEADAKISGLTGGKYRSKTLAGDLMWRVKHKMEDFVDMKGITKRWEQRGGGAGGGWFEATRDVPGGEIYFRFYSIEKGNTEETKGKLVDGRYGRENKLIGE